MNNFKQLEEDQILLFKEEKEKKLFDNLESTLGTLRFFGAIFELYMPVMADTMVSMGGGSPTVSDEPDSLDDMPPIDKPKGPKGLNGPIR